MNILVISGFLGAGKTSFIKAMAKACQRQFVVVENEFGEMNLDGPMLAKEDLENMSKEEALSKMEIWELTEGCICCSMNMDFSQSILTIANALDPDYLLVEPSGVAHPNRIFENLRNIQYNRIRLLKGITIMDGENYVEYRHTFPEHFNDQVESAGTLVLSKSEDLNEEDFLRIGADIGIPDDCTFPLRHYSKWEREDWFRLLEDYDPSFLEKFAEVLAEERAAEHNHHHHVETHAHGHSGADMDMEEMEHIGFTAIDCFNPADLIAKLHVLISGRFGHTIRAKGYFPCRDEYLYFDLVNKSYQIHRCPDMDDSRLVVIGRYLDREGLEKLFLGTAMSKEATEQVIAEMEQPRF